LSHKFNAKKMVWTFEQTEPLKFSEPMAINFKIVVPDVRYKNPIYDSPLVNIFSPPPEA